MLLSLVKTVTVVAPADLSRCLPRSSNEIHTLDAFACVFSILPLKMAVECVFVSVVFVPLRIVCSCFYFFVTVFLWTYFVHAFKCSSTCVVWSQHGSRSLHQCVWVACVLGVLCVWCGRGRKAALFCICVCVWTRLCVVWSKAEKRASVHMGTDDRIWF